MKKFMNVLASCLLLVGCSNAKTTSNEKTAKVGVIQLVSHTSLNQIHDAFLDEMKALGYEDGVNFELNDQNAQGDINNVTTIVQTMKGKEDVVVAITTPVAQASVDLAQNGTPVVFSAVSDPIAAGLLKDLNVTDNNMTGTSDAVMMDQILDLALSLQPELKSFGYIYNAGEDNSVSNLKKVETYCSEKGYTLKTATITSGNELSTAVTTLGKDVDAFIIGNDNTVAENMPIVVESAKAINKPVYVGADSMVIDGGLATVGIDYVELGKETAHMVDKVLKGEPVSKLPVKVFDSNLYVYINQTRLKELGITLPDTIKNNPKLVLVD